MQIMILAVMKLHCNVKPLATYDESEVNCKNTMLPVERTELGSEPLQKPARLASRVEEVLAPS